MLWQAPKIEISADALCLETATARLPGAELRFLLGLWPDGGAGRSVDASLDLIGMAWSGPGRMNSWGWPEGEGHVQPREFPSSPEVCVSFPAALSLTLVLRRACVELGVRCVVLGAGYLGRMAATVATRMGYRVRATPSAGELSPSDVRWADIVIETTGQVLCLTESLTLCRDWGKIFICGSALSQGQLDYYTDVHRRGLSLYQVPLRPTIYPEEESVVERGLPLLAEALSDLRVRPDQVVPVRGTREGITGTAVRETSGGWCLVRLDSVQST